MPVLASFYGIVIRMYFQQSEHNPPHIHARYGEYNAVFSISEGTILDGEFPSKARAMVSEWIEMNQDSLLEMWETQEFRKLPPLD